MLPRRQEAELATLGSSGQTALVTHGEMIVSRFRAKGSEFGGSVLLGFRVQGFMFRV